MTLDVNERSLREGSLALFDLRSRVERSRDWRILEVESDPPDPSSIRAEAIRERRISRRDGPRLWLEEVAEERSCAIRSWMAIEEEGMEGLLEGKREEEGRGRSGGEEREGEEEDGLEELSSISVGGGGGAAAASEEESFSVGA